MGLSHIYVLHAWRTTIMLQLSEESSKLKHEWLADQTQLVSSVSETERFTEEVRAMGFAKKPLFSSQSLTYGSKYSHEEFFS